MDWAMKFQEAKKNWFGKKGISWHVSAVVTKIEENEYQVCINKYRVQHRLRK
jgi:hypothetical protein